jgi:Uma2 family endonuclease
MNAPVVPKARMTVVEFLEWSDLQPDDRCELVDGKVVAMTRDIVRHNQTKFAACRALDHAVRAARLPSSAPASGEAT